MISADPHVDLRAARHIRILDLVLVSITFPIWGPILVVLGLLVVFTSGRPLLYRQRRVGRNGEVFAMLKFRSMVNGDNPLVPDPDTITPIGRILRRTSLDELPQLLNVVGGQMSLVGPRPMLPTQVGALSPDQALRHVVRPGLTGLAQVNGRNSLHWDARFAHDLEWARAPLPRRYFQILARTFSVVAGGDGVSGHDASDRFVDVASASETPAMIRLIDFDLTGSSHDEPTQREVA